MFKRARWMGMGFAAGVGTTVWANVKLKERAQRLTPTALGEEAARRARNLGGDLRDAVADGRRAMADREAQLRATRPRLAPPTAPEQVAVPAAAGGPRLRALPGPGAPAATRRGGAAGSGPAVAWTDHGYERPSARLS